MKSDRNEEYTIWTDYDGLDEADIKDTFDVWNSSYHEEDADG